MKRSLSLLVLAGLALALGSCASGGTTPPSPTAGSAIQVITLSSSAFAPEAAIPVRYSCNGEDVSPPLQWSEPPAGTQSFALIVDDPDAGGFRHWLIYRIPGTARGLAEAVSADAEQPDGSRQGQSSWGKLGYGGPCPPSGTHRYSFRLYALDIMPDLAAGASVGQLYQAMQGHIVAQGELIGVYTRQQ